MLTKRENSMAILKGEQPDYYGDFMDTVTIVPDPAFLSDRIPQDGEIYKDSWGVEFIFPPGAPGKHPVDRPGHMAINDIEHWQDELVVPNLKELDWTETKELAAEVNRKETFLTVFNTAGLFERSHHLLGFEEALVDYMMYEEEVAGLLRVIADYKIEFINIVAQEIQPDVIFYQDDWGSKTNVFLPPELWRRIIKPLHTEIVKAAHDNNILFMHHADCYCEPLVLDMVEMGIDIWQGAIPQNDIVEIQRITKGKLPMIGGIDGPKIDVEGASEEEIRAEVRRTIDTYCPGGKFFPGNSSGKLFREWNHSIFQDELERYGRQWALEHPLA